MNIIVLHTKNGDIPAIVPDARQIRINHTVVNIKGKCQYLDENKGALVALGRLLVEVGKDIYNVVPGVFADEEGEKVSE